MDHVKLMKREKVGEKEREVSYLETYRGCSQGMAGLPMVVGYRPYLPILWKPISPALSPAQHGKGL